ncbi:O-antigen ligase family protein, partial [bacterium]|nr:O-antigen ligase family protein [bacterium]
MFGILSDIKETKALYKYIAAASIILLAIYIGNSIAASGKVQVRILMFSVPFIIFWMQRLSDKARFKMMLLAILLVPLQMPKIPLNFSLSELLIIILAFLQFPIFKYAGQRSINKEKMLNIWEMVPYALFAMAGMLVGIINGGMGTWHVVCTIPLFWMLLASSIVNTSEESFTMLKVAVYSILGCLFIVWLANITGNVTFDYTKGWRMGGQIIAIGPVKYIFYATTFGTLIAIMFPLVIMLLFRKGKSTFEHLFYGFVLILFVWILLTSSARGASIGALAGGTLILILLGRYHFSREILIFLIVFLLLIALQRPIFSKFSHIVYPNIERFDKILHGIWEVDSFKARIEIIKFTIENIKINPFGYGFNHLWNNYGIDEAILYSALLNGTGVIGMMGFIFIIGILFFNFTRTILKGTSHIQYELAALGMGTLICGIIAGISS